MKKSVLWTVSYKVNGVQKKISCFSKRAAIHEYLDTLELPFVCNVSELKIFKNDTEYTSTLNRFLER